MITDNQRTMLRLIERSPDVGDGWRQVSSVLWRHVLDQAHPDLTELDRRNLRVRLNEKGRTVLEYSL